MAAHHQVDALAVQLGHGAGHGLGGSAGSVTSWMLPGPEHVVVVGPLGGQLHAALLFDAGAALARRPVG